MSRSLTLIGTLILVLAWSGPLPRFVDESFTAHMLLHMAVVGIGVPILAAGLAPQLAGSRLFAAQIALPLVVSFLDLIVVWLWHTPVLHMAARSNGMVLALEQVSFALVSLLVWLVALVAQEGRRQEAALAGALALFFTSMHMTLLGGLVALSRQPVFAHGPEATGHHGAALAGAGAQLADQQLGGAIMLIIGGVIYLGGALVLFGRVLRREEAA